MFTFTSMIRGFTLIELSIVLVIIGLIVGGVLVGRDLIKAAELRKVTSQFQSFQAAVNTFKLKYNCIPGDCNNAETFFGTAANCPGTHLQPSTDATTCNGDGDKRVERQGTTDNLTTTQNENFRFWQHLASAGLIEGQYTGVAYSGSSTAASDSTNCPTGGINGSLWCVEFINTTAATYASMFSSGGNVVDGVRHYFRFGAQRANSIPASAILTNQEAWMIDDKIDDGAPGQGRVKSYNNTFLSDCADSDTPSTAAYQLSNDGKECALLFEAGF